eukprot:scaffold5067_cov65-Phaeocystis_antarctica.AAC.2
MPPAALAVTAEGASCVRVRGSFGRHADHADLSVCPSVHAIHGDIPAHPNASTWPRTPAVVHVLYERQQSLPNTAGGGWAGLG